MKQHKFRTYGRYVKAQTALTRHKMSKPHGARCFTSEKVVDKIRAYHHGSVIAGLCHGVRTGLELGLFGKVFSVAEWYGTEITPELCDGERIFNYDFAEERLEWIEQFDIVYTNSLDHAMDPEKTVGVWLRSLAPGGVLYVEWTEWHEKLGKRGNTADCYAASLGEYLKLLNTVGVVDAILPVPDRATKDGRSYTRFIFAVSNRT